MSLNTYLVYDRYYGISKGVYDTREQAVEAAKKASIRDNKTMSVYGHHFDVTTKIDGDRIFTFEM